MLLRVAILLCGVYAGSTSVLWVKNSQIPPVLLSGYRLLAASILLSGLFFRDWARHRDAFGWKDVRKTVVPAVLLGLHFITWIFGARRTSAANATLLVNMVPIVTPVLLLTVAFEKVRRIELLGTAVAMAGVCVLGVSDLQMGRGQFVGDVVCFASMLLFAAYMTFGRRNRHFASVWLYVVPLYFVGGLLCLAVGLCLQVGRPSVVYDLNEATMILGLALVPTIVGHSALNYSMRHFRGQVVGVANVFEFVFAAVMAFLIYDEKPALSFYLAAAMVTAAAAIMLHHHHHARRRPQQLPESDP